MKYKIVLDTNVLVSGLCRSIKSPTYEIVSNLGKKYELCLTPSIYLEYKDVLHRSKIKKLINLNKNEINTVLHYIADIGQKFLTYYTWRPNLNDESDNKFIECAIVSNADFVITGNIKHYKVYNITPIHYQVITPRNFIDNFGGK